MKDLISVGALMSEFRIANTSQRDLLRKHGIRSAYATPKGRGYSHYITPQDADRLRQALVWGGKRLKAKVTHPAQPGQIVLDAIETKESFWSRAKQALFTLTGR